jgi:hypothetical protein
MEAILKYLKHGPVLALISAVFAYMFVKNDPKKLKVFYWIALAVGIYVYITHKAGKENIFASIIKKILP